MAVKYVNKFFQFDDGTRAGQLLGNSDPRGYRPPPCFSAFAEIVDVHPVTHRYLDEGQWWLFLVPNTVNNIMSRVYLSQLTNEKALQQLMQLDSKALAETLLDCFHRGECRFLFCNPEGEAY